MRQQLRHRRCMCGGAPHAVRFDARYLSDLPMQ